MDYSFSITSSTYVEIASLWMRGRGQRMIDGQVMLPGVYQSITLSNSRIHARVLKSGCKDRKCLIEFHVNLVMTREENILCIG